MLHWLFEARGAHCKMHHARRSWRPGGAAAVGPDADLGRRPAWHGHGRPSLVQGRGTLTHQRQSTVVDRLGKREQQGESRKKDSVLARCGATGTVGVEIASRFLASVTADPELILPPSLCRNLVPRTSRRGKHDTDVGRFGSCCTLSSLAARGARHEGVLLPLAPQKRRRGGCC